MFALQHTGLTRRHGTVGSLAKDVQRAVTKSSTPCFGPAAHHHIGHFHQMATITVLTKDTLGRCAHTPVPIRRRHRQANITITTGIHIVLGDKKVCGVELLFLDTQAEHDTLGWVVQAVERLDDGVGQETLLGYRELTCVADCHSVPNVHGVAHKPARWASQVVLAHDLKTVTLVLDLALLGRHERLERATSQLVAKGKLPAPVPRTDLVVASVVVVAVVRLTLVTRGDGECSEPVVRHEAVIERSQTLGFHVGGLEC